MLCKERGLCLVDSIHFQPQMQNLPQTSASSDNLSFNLHDILERGGSPSELNLIPEFLKTSLAKKVTDPRGPLDIKDTYIGIEIEMADFNCSITEFREKLDEYIKDGRLSEGWNAKGDGSIKCQSGYGIETVSPKLKIKDGALDEIRLVYKIIKETGGKANSSCGLHFHVDGKDLNHKDLLNLVKLELMNENVLYELAKGNDEKFRGMTYTYPLSQFGASLIPVLQSKTIEELNEIYKNIDRRTSLNLCSFWKHGTVEFRVNNATDDPEIAISSLENWLNIVKSAHDSSFEEIPLEYIDKASPDEELRKFPVSGDVFERYLKTISGAGPFSDILLKRLENLQKRATQENDTKIKEQTLAVRRANHFTEKGFKFVSNSLKLNVTPQLYALMPTIKGLMLLSPSENLYKPSDETQGINGLLDGNIAPSEYNLKYHYGADNIVRSLVLDDEKDLYLRSAGGKIYSLDTGGNLRFCYEADGLAMSSLHIDSKRNLFFTVDNKLFSLDKHGDLRFSCKVGEAGDDFISPEVDTEGNVCFVAEKRKLHCMDKDGIEKFTLEFDEDINRPPIFDNEGNINLISDEGNFYSYKNNGELKSTFSVGRSLFNYFYLAFGKKGDLYLAADKKLDCFDRDGKPRFQFDAKDKNIIDLKTDSEDNLYFKLGYKKLTSLDKQGNLRFSYETDSEITSPPSIDSEGNTYFATEDGNLYFLDREGKLRFRYNTGCYISNDLLIDNEKNVYFCGNKKACCIQPTNIKKEFVEEDLRLVREINDEWNIAQA